jgi:hypothetical protein
MAFALHKDPAEPFRRTMLHLQITAVTLAWLVAVPILVVYGLTGTEPGGRVFLVAALLTLVFPFSAAVLATRRQRFGIGAAYIVLTLLMVVPAMAIARAG